MREGLLHWVYEPDWNAREVCDFDADAWVSSARCAGSDTNLFYRVEAAYDRDYLTLLCAGCPVQPNCLAHALYWDEEGWWGGTSKRDRQRMPGRRVGVWGNH